MESDLLEISGEDDDSLLLQNHQSPNGGVSAFNASYFSCSPLNFRGSNPSDEKGVNPSHSSNVDKENVNYNVNKSELPKLSMEPQQMKRKKKGGGYNLRKSLAWNRAFSTDEGVLNSTELSLISGDFGKLSGGTLSVIEEEMGESLSGDSIDFRALENNLFKELPLNNSAKSEEKKVGGNLLQKSSGSAPRSAVKQNVLSVHDVNRSGSKRSGCRRPVTSSALKRPANMSTTKAATKEPKLLKLPAPKPCSSALSTTSNGALNINKTKRNQSAQAAVSAHRSIALTGSKKSIRSSQKDAKAGLPSKSQVTKSSAQHAKRNVGSSALGSPSSTYLQNPLVIKADNVLKVKQDPIVAAGDRSPNHEMDSNKIASIPQSGSHSGGNTQYARPLIAKPSGLRMPSPSLGFFSQSKTNASQNLQKSTQSSKNSNTNIPNPRKPGVLNSIREIPTSLMKAPVVSNGVAAVTNQGMSSLESSVPSSVKPCQDIGPTSQTPRVEVKVLSNSDNHELMNNHQQLHTIEDNFKQQIDENVGLQVTDNKILLESQSPEQGKLDYKRRAGMAISRTPVQHGDEFKDPHFFSYHSLQTKSALKTDVVGNQLSGNEQQDSLTEDLDLFPKLLPIDVNCDIHGSSVKVDQISRVHGIPELPSKQAEWEKPCTFGNGQMINETERPHSNDRTMLKEGQTSEGFLSCHGAQSGGICQKVMDRSACELERSNGLSHYRDRIQGKDDAGEAAEFDLKSHVGSAQIHSFEGDPSLENGTSLLNVSEADDPHLIVEAVKVKLVEQPPLADPGIVGERVFQDKYGSQSIDGFVHEENFSSGKLLAESNLRSAKYVGAELADTSQNELGNTGAPLIPPALQNGGHEMVDEVQCLYVENAVSISTDLQCNHDIEHLSEATSVGLERIAEDQVTVAINACDIGVTNEQQSSGALNGKEIYNFHPESQTSPVVRFKGSSEMDDIIDFKSVEGNQRNLAAKCNSDIFDPEEQSNCCHVDTAAMLANSSLDKQYDLEKSIAQAELIHSCEAHKLSQENQMPETHHSLLSLEGKVFQESHSFDSDIYADVSSKDKSSFRKLVEGAFVLSQVDCPDEPNEECGLGANEMTTRSSQENVRCQSFDNSSLHLFTLTENDNFAMVVEDVNEPPQLRDAVTVEEILSDKSQFSVNNEVSSSIKIKVPDNNHDCYNDNNQEQSGQAASLNFVLSSLSEDQISAAGSSCNSQALSSLNDELTSSSGNVCLKEINILEKNVPQELNSAVISVEADCRTTLLEKNGNEKEQVAAVVKPPPNAIPFSDEWLAAFETAGEEILTMKSGAVQHSPKDKSLPEPSPWSPVRRKNNQGIGPFDCTKFTNTNIPSAGSD